MRFIRMWCDDGPPSIFQHAHLRSGRGGTERMPVVRDIARLCPRGRLVLIPEVAHTLCYTAPVELADVTRSFVNEAKDLML